MAKYIYFAEDTQFHDYQNQPCSLFNHLKDNPYSGMTPLTIPITNMGNSKKNVVYEFAMNNNTSFHKGDNCIENRIDLKYLRSVKNIVVVVSTGVEDYNTIKQWYDDLITTYPFMRKITYIHSKLFFTQDELPIISSLTLDDDDEQTVGDDANLIGLMGDTCSTEYLATKAFVSHYELNDSFSVSGSYFNDHIETPSQWKHRKSWFDDEPGFKKFVMKTCPMYYDTYHDSRVKVYASSHKSDSACQLFLGELINPSVWYNMNTKIDVISNTDLSSCAVSLKHIDPPENRVALFREEFRQARFLVSMDSDRQNAIINDLQDITESNKKVLSGNDGFIKGYEMLQRVSYYDVEHYPTVKGKSHSNISIADYNSLERKSLVIIQGHDTFSSERFKGALSKIRIIKCEVEEETKLIHTLSELRRSANSDMVVYIHGSFLNTPRVVNTIKSIQSKGAVVYSNNVANNKIKRIQSKTTDTITNELIYTCRGGHNIALSVNIDTDIPNHSHLSEQDILDSLKKKNNIIVPISDITNGVGITEYFDEHQINYTPVFCATIYGENLVNEKALNTAMDMYGDRLDVFFLNLSQFLNEAISLYPYSYLFYDMCIMWMLEKTGRLPYVVSVNNYNRMLSYHNFSKKNKKVGTYQHQFAAASVHLGDYDEFSINIGHEYTIIEEITSEVYCNAITTKNNSHIYSELE